MRILLDTHAFLWFIAGDPKLSLDARSLIADSDTLLFLSAASLWEIAIKASLGKLTLLESYETLIHRQLSQNSITLIPTELKHFTALLNLPHHHRDPFDRLIIVQALVEELAIVTKDSFFSPYPVHCIW